LAYSEFYFEKSYWPEFSEEIFDGIIDNFNKRERRHGK
jgi:undecaprenyl diphosphate synthase